MSGSIDIVSTLYREGKEEGRRKKEEEKEKPEIWCKYFPNFYTNDTSGHDIIFLNIIY